MPHDERKTTRRGAGALGLALAAVAAAGCPMGVAAGSRALAQDRGARPAGQAGSATQRLVLGTYYYSYQGDPRKGVPTRDIRDAKGLCRFTYHPWESVGPWLSFDRAQWHRSQFQMMAAGGIDVALAVYRGDAGSRAGYAVKGLDVMTQALKELRSEGQEPFARARDYPQIGMALDLGGLAEQYGGPVSLKDADVARSLYGMVRDFYLHVPEEFRATVLLPRARQTGEAPASASSPQGAACLVRLIDDAAVKDADDAFLSYANKRFAQEFGQRLVWIGTPALKAKVGRLDAVAAYPGAAEKVTVRTDGWIRAASLGPGYDDTQQGAGGKIRPRENGKTAYDDFKAAMEAGPDWIFLDSWNGFRSGTGISPTLEYGLMYRDLTRAAALQFKQDAEYSVSILRAAAPRVVQPGQVYQVDVSVQNTGINDWTAEQNVAVSYQWLQDGKRVGGPGFPTVVDNQVHGETRSYTLGLVSPVEKGMPLPPGEYELEINLNRPVGDETVWFENGGGAPYRVPVTVGPAPAARPYWINSSAPALARRGAAYPAQVRLRNDGSTAWKKGAFSVGYRWRKISSYLKGAGDEQDTVVAEGPRVPLAADVPPGRVVTVDAPVSTNDAQGQPLPTWSPKDPWSYVLEWDVFDGQKPLSQSGGTTYREAVEVVDRDPAPSFLGCNLAPELVAGRTEKITVGIRNDGPEAWKKERDKVIVHWYYLDGTEASWNDDSLALPEDVPPFSRFEVDAPSKTFAESGQNRTKKDKGVRKETVRRPTVLREVPVRVPYYFGPMYCVLDFQHDGMFASTGPASKGTDILVIPVNVFSPTFTPFPLNAYFNLDGMSEDVARADGNLDGRGNSLPAELLPPYVGRPVQGELTAASPLYPSGLWVRPLNDIDSSRVCFLYPFKGNNEPNMLACQGQRIELAPLPRMAVHLLALSTEEDARGEFVLHYSDGTSEKRPVTFTHWNDPPKHGERIAFTIAHRHTLAGDDPATRCYLFQYTLPAERLKYLTAVELPRQPAVKILAMTMESAVLRPAQ